MKNYTTAPATIDTTAPAVADVTAPAATSTFKVTYYDSDKTVITVKTYHNVTDRYFINAFTADIECINNSIEFFSTVAAVTVIQQQGKKSEDLSNFFNAKLLNINNDLSEKSEDLSEDEKQHITASFNTQIADIIEDYNNGFLLSLHFITAVTAVVNNLRSFYAMKKDITAADDLFFSLLLTDTIAFIFTD